MNLSVRHWRPIALQAALTMAFVGAGYRAGKRFRRFAISGPSMEPELRGGDWVIVDEHAYHSALPRRGHIVIATDPRDHGRTLVKRISGVTLHGEVRLEGDNIAESTDSRHFGLVPLSLVRGRVRWRYWPPGRAGSVL